LDRGYAEGNKKRREQDSLRRGLKELKEKEWTEKLDWIAKGVVTQGI